MDPEKLKSLVTQLHQELADAETLPPELQGEVGEVVAEMTALLAHAEPPPGGHHSVLEKLEGYAAGFDVEHPKLAGAIRQISVALGNLGI